MKRNTNAKTKTITKTMTKTEIIHVKVAHGKSSRPDGLKQIPEICSRLTKTLMFNSKPCFTE